MAYPLQVLNSLGSTAQYIREGTTESALSITNLATGKVGIGTNNPQHALHTIGANKRMVVSGNSSTCYSTINAINSDNDNIELVAYGRSAGGSYLGQTRKGSMFVGATPGTDQNAVMGVGTTNSKPLVLGTNNAERMRITADGKIEITGNVTATESSSTSGIKTTMNLTTSLNCVALYAVSIDPVFSEPYSCDNIGCLKIEPSGAMIDYGIRVVMPSGAANEMNCGIKVEVPEYSGATGVYAYIDQHGSGYAIRGNAYSDNGAFGGYFEAQSGSTALKTKGVSIVHGYLKIGVAESPDATPTEALDVNGNIKTSGQILLGNVRFGAGSLPSTSDPNWKYRGSLFIRTSNGKLYINTAANGATIVWTVVGSQS
ncbi:MAG: hypothetical protein JXA18_08890 [Chitinispirillaceae bacterium]|nr:hypothetical protein [Chitinispirillaceae bacterium]